MKRFKIIINLFFLLLAFFIFHTSYFVHRPRAFTFSSDSYIIDWGNFNITSGKKSSTNYNLTDTVGQNAPGLFASSGYKVKSGFQYIYETMAPFSFVINDLDIDFGTLTPQIGTTASNTLAITSPSGHGYQILASESHPLYISPTSAIPDFTGDNGTASESISDTWNLETTHGFGFNAQGHGTSAYFATPNHFRQFADFSQNEPAQIIASEDTPQKDRSQTITYKVNISPLQAAGRYQTAITFTAVPKY